MKKKTFEIIQAINFDRFWWSCIIILTLVKYWLTSNLPLHAAVRLQHDDGLMVKLASTIINGEWLGEYSCNTLVKGCMFPLFLAFVRWSGCNYSHAIITLYIFACIIFCIAIRKFVHNNKFVSLLYIVLLFNPASMDFQSYQRIYRCALIPMLVLLIFGSFFALYYDMCEEIKITVTKFLWAGLAGFSLFVFYNTREESVWIMPFVIVIVLISAFMFFLRTKGKSEKNIIGNIFILFIPIFVLIMGNCLIGNINYKYYGIRVRNEVSTTAFPECIKAIYSVKGDDEIPYVTNSRAKMKRLYEISPTLQSINSELEASLDGWDYNDGSPGDGEVDDGFFFWALRSAVSNAGYYASAQNANDFYAAVAYEINEAIEKGLVEKQATMPSALMSPWRSSRTGDFLQSILKSIDLIFTFKDTDAHFIVHDKDDIDKLLGVYYQFTDATNNHFLESATTLFVSGWVFSENSEANISVVLVSEDGNENINLPLHDSMDVYTHFQNEDYAAENMTQCRFSFEGTCNAGSKYYLQIITPNSRNNFIYESGDVQLDDESIHYAIDNFNRYAEGNSTIIGKWAVEKVNGISNIYKQVNIYIGALSILVYIIIILQNLYVIYKKQYTMEYWNELMILTALLASLIVLIIGVSYTDAYSFAAVNSIYFAGAYAMALSFEMISLFCGAKRIKAVYRQKIHRF